MPFAPSDMILVSPAFDPNARIPKENTGEGADLSPELSWTNPPDGTRSFAVICHDPDAPLVSPNGTYGFVHWVLYGVPSSIRSLPKGTEEYTAGKNDMGNKGYNGPMPPAGHGSHSYYFWIIALDEDIDLEPGLTMWELLSRIEPRIIGMNRLVGTYSRS